MSFWKRLFGKSSTPAVRKRDDQPDVYDIPNEDTAMSWGIEKANLTLWYFQESLAQPRPNQQYFSVKAKIHDGPNVEHIWLTEPHFDEEGNMFGTVGNRPIDVRNVRLGEKIGVAPEKVSDWLILEEGRLIGGYTIRAVRDGLEGKALAQFDAGLGGMIVDEGEDHFPVDRSTPEGAILTLEAAYDADDLSGVLACKDFRIEAEDMAKEQGLPFTPDIQDSLAEVIELTFVKHLQEEGMPKFTDVKRAFLYRESIGENKYLITEICTHADGQKSMNRMPVVKVGEEWKVLAPVE